MKEQLQKAITEGKEVTVYLKSGCDRRIKQPIVAVDETGIVLKVYEAVTLVPWSNIDRIHL